MASIRDWTGAIVLYHRGLKSCNIAHLTIKKEVVQLDSKQLGANTVQSTNNK